MNDKAFELLEKMYIEFSSSNKKMEADIGGMKDDVKHLKNDVVMIENKLNNHSTALFDGFYQHNNQLSRIEEKLDELIEKVEQHDLRLHVIES